MGWHTSRDRSEQLCIGIGFLTQPSDWAQRVLRFMVARNRRHHACLVMPTCLVQSQPLHKMSLARVIVLVAPTCAERQPLVFATHACLDCISHAIRSIQNNAKTS